MRNPTTIIDRYLLRQFAQVFLICFTSLTGLYVMIDGFSNLDEFLSAAEKEGSLLRLMAGYYTYKSVFFFDRISGILTMISAMFTLAWIQRHNELTALMAAGVSRLRVVTPVVCAAVGLALLTAANRELFMPTCREELARNPKDLLGEAAHQLRPRYDNRTDILIQGTHTYANERRIRQPAFMLRGPLSAYGAQLVGEDAYYRPAGVDHPAGYFFTGVSQPAGLHEKPSLALGDRTVIITPRDAPGWLKRDECFVVSDVTFEQLTAGRDWRQFASTAQLITGLRDGNVDSPADVKVSIHARIVQPLMDVTLLFIGLPLVVTRSNRSVYVAVGVCLVLVSVFLLAVIGCRYLGANYLMDPALAAWLPLMLFVPLTFELAQALRS
jgi:lipopolysaccharide export system permease protein